MSAAAWRKSSYSTATEGLCVEVADNLPGLIPVRDTKDRRRPAVIVTAIAWTPFVQALKAGGLTA
ncbi:DUF397 domain-containing protein [Streptomyces sp. NPDC002602]|uniref:DUF397 domain-containing protein n=1 Tax=Streptomyces sp. NPDC002602 TaxID=3364654 RepID=UPI0036BB2D7F